MDPNHCVRAKPLILSTMSVNYWGKQWYHPVHETHVITFLFQDHNCTYYYYVLLKMSNELQKSRSLIWWYAIQNFLSCSPHLLILISSNARWIHLLWIIEGPWCLHVTFFLILKFPFSYFHIPFPVEGWIEVNAQRSSHGHWHD